MTTDQFSDTDVCVAKNHRRLTMLKEIGLALESTMTFDEVLSMAVARTTEVMEAERSTLFLANENGCLISRTTDGGDIREIRLPFGQGLAGWTAVHRVPLLVTNAYADDRFDSTWDALTGFFTRGVMCHPIMGKQGRIIGVAEVLNRIDGDFSEDDLSLLGVVCSQLAMTIENSRMMIDLVEKNRAILEAKQNLEQRNLELQMLLDMESILARAEDLDSMGLRVFQRILQTVDAGVGSIYIQDSDGASIRVYSRDGRVNHLIRVDAGAGFAGWSASRGEDLCISVPEADPRFDRNLLKRAGIVVQNVAAVPLPFPESSAIRGSLLVANKPRTQGFDEADMMLMRLSAAQLSQAIEHLRDRDARERERRLATVGRLLAGVLHDLKSPVTVISGYAEMLAEQVPDGEGADYLAKIHQALSRITNMAKDIVAFSRGEREIMPHPVQLAEFVERFVSQIQLYLQSNNIDFVVRVRTAGTIRVDEEKLIRAFNNICTNAVEAMPEQGRLIFEADRIGNDLVFSFTDFGKGIPEEIQGSLFQSFVTMGKEQGSGLGLALVRKIVDGHGGQINYTTSRGGGTTFLITIPAGA